MVHQYMYRIPSNWGVLGKIKLNVIVINTMYRSKTINILKKYDVCK